MESGGELEVENVGEVGLASERFEVETIDPEEDAEEEDSGVEQRYGEPKQNVQVGGTQAEKITFFCLRFVAGIRNVHFTQTCSIF